MLLSLPWLSSSSSSCSSPSSSSLPVALRKENPARDIGGDGAPTGLNVNPPPSTGGLPLLPSVSSADADGAAASDAAASEEVLHLASPGAGSPSPWAWKKRSIAALRLCAASSMPAGGISTAGLGPSAFEASTSDTLISPASTSAAWPSSTTASGAPGAVWLSSWDAVPLAATHSPASSCSGVKAPACRGLDRGDVPGEPEAAGGVDVLTGWARVSASRTRPPGTSASCSASNAATWVTSKRW